MYRMCSAIVLATVCVSASNQVGPSTYGNELLKSRVQKSARGLFEAPRSVSLRRKYASSSSKLPFRGSPIARASLLSSSMLSSMNEEFTPTERSTAVVVRQLKRGTKKTQVQVKKTRSDESEQDERMRQELKNMIPGVIGTVGGILTLIDQGYVAATACPPEWITPQVERWGAVVVLSTFFCSMLARLVTGGFLTDFIERQDGSMTKSGAALYLKIAEILAILGIVYSGGVTTVQVARYGVRWDIQRVADRVCYYEARDREFLDQFGDSLVQKRFPAEDYYTINKRK